MSKFIKTIKYFLIISIILFAYIYKSKNLTALDVIPQEVESNTNISTKVEDKSYYVGLVYKYAKEYNVSPQLMIDLITCENRDWNPTLQSYITYNDGQISRHPHWGNVGDREKSFGLAQFHIVDLNITYEQAINPNFAIREMAKWISQGKVSRWSCYRIVR